MERTALHLVASADGAGAGGSRESGFQVSTPNETQSANSSGADGLVDSACEEATGDITGTALVESATGDGAVGASAKAVPGDGAGTPLDADGGGSNPLVDRRH